jgi:hypothetical protein
MMRVIVAQLSVQFIAPIRSSVEIRAHDFAQDFEHLVDERGGGRGGDVTRAQCRRTARPGDAVEVGEVSDKELPQALQLRDQLPALTFGHGGEPPILEFRQRLRDRAGGRCDDLADVALEEGRGPSCSFDGGGGGGRKGGNGGCRIHGALSEAAVEA